MTLQNLLKAVKDGEGNADLANVDDVTGHNTSRLPLANQVAITIRDMIVQDSIKPGERIRERQLSEELNVSRTPTQHRMKSVSCFRFWALLKRSGDDLPPKMHATLK